MPISSIHLATTVLLATLVLPHAVRGGIVDTPLPAPFTQHVFSIPGAISNGGLGTFVSCTNLDTTNVTIGVELFPALGGAAGNDAAASALSVGPGATVIFATGTAAGILIDSDLTSGAIGSKGSARVLATSKRITCTAWIADRLSSPPTVAWSLIIIAKTKQKAFN